MKKKTLLFGAMAALMACTQAQAGNKTHSLVVYYSQSGTTEKVANIIQKKTGADTERLQPVNHIQAIWGQLQVHLWENARTASSANSSL